MPATNLPGGPLPAVLPVSVFPDVFEQRAISRTLPWPALAERLASFPVRAGVDDKRRLPCWSPARFAGEGSSAAQVHDLCCLVLDLDGGIGIDEALDRCAPFTVALHTSWSHRPAAPCFRLVLPLAQPVPRAGWTAAWSAAVAALGLPVDRACSNANRRYLLPARPAPEAHTRTELRLTGLALDLAPLAAPPEAHARPAAEMRSVVVPLHRVERAVRRRLALDPAARRRLADAQGAVVRGTGAYERAEGIVCPACGRPSAWFLLAPERATRARCKHRKSCGWSAPVSELIGSAA
jgi:hypothetical protein